MSRPEKQFLQLFLITNRATVLRPPPGMKIQHSPEGIREYVSRNLQISKITLKEISAETTYLGTLADYAISCENLFLYLGESCGSFALQPKPKLFRFRFYSDFSLTLLGATKPLLAN
ncbi:hypothetical protein PROFUN_16122 [Planoprotostelium fungivorum]|uniref:Uncharacterized protein n=1 Tax=Planoprotostelium fungivorum TaxID=1890364 RepID=A0A2P6MSL4_9EUKA|nr:hypothetical protein PROFUN_16122 [Planoprotostelium fungivorum]